MLKVKAENRVIRRERDCGKSEELKDVMHDCITYYKMRK